MLQLTTLLALLATASAVNGQFSDAQLLSVFGTSASELQGASQALPQFRLSVASNTTHALISLNSTAASASEIGWMGIGAGTAMANADFLITWPSPSGGWVLSHRRPITVAEGEGMPISTGSTSTYYTLLPELSSATTVTFLRPLTMPAGYPSSSPSTVLSRATTSFIYASSTNSPASADEGATITQHNQAHAAITLELSNAIVVAAASPSSAGATSGSAAASASAVAPASSATRSASGTIASASASASPRPVSAAGSLRRDVVLGVASALLAGVVYVV